MSLEAIALGLACADMVGSLGIAYGIGYVAGRNDARTGTASRFNVIGGLTLAATISSIYPILSSAFEFYIDSPPGNNYFESASLHMASLSQSPAQQGIGVGVNFSLLCLPMKFIMTGIAFGIGYKTGYRRNSQ